MDMDTVSGIWIKIVCDRSLSYHPSITIMRFTLRTSCIFMNPDALTAASNLCPWILCTWDIFIAHQEKPNWLILHNSTKLNKLNKLTKLTLLNKVFSKFSEIKQNIFEIFLLTKICINWKKTYCKDVSTSGKHPVILWHLCLQKGVFDIFGPKCVVWAHYMSWFPSVVK